MPGSVFGWVCVCVCVCACACVSVCACVCVHVRLCSMLVRPLFLLLLWCVYEIFYFFFLEGGWCVHSCFGRAVCAFVCWL